MTKQYENTHENNPFNESTPEQNRTLPKYLIAYVALMIIYPVVHNFLSDIPSLIVKDLHETLDYTNGIYKIYASTIFLTVMTALFILACNYVIRHMIEEKFIYSAVTVVVPLLILLYPFVAFSSGIVFLATAAYSIMTSPLYVIALIEVLIYALFCTLKVRRQKKDANSEI